MKNLSDTGKATVADFSTTNGVTKDGSTNVEVSYSYEFVELETASELAEKFSPEALRDLANARLKSTANSGARQKAIAQYTQDPNSPAATRERVIKDMAKIFPNKSREELVMYLDSIAAA